jgi:TrmH family RNA methyltransferase
MITSVQNPKIKLVQALRNRRDREQTGLMRVEGFEEISLAIASGLILRSLYYCPALFSSSEQVVLLDIIRSAGAELVEVSRTVFEKISYREGPDGWLATCPSFAHGLEHLQLGRCPCLLVAEGIEKPGNLGAMLRTADAAGIEGVIAADPVTDWGNPNVVRASKGAVFSVAVAQASTPETIAWLRSNGIRIVAATPQSAMPYTQARFVDPVAIVVGSEKQGLSAEWIDAADVQVTIPMLGRVNSLNVATAAALLVYEVVNQRTAEGRQPAGR